MTDELHEQEPGGPDKCVCPDCGYETDKERGTPCRAMECPECGASLVAGTEQEAEAMPVGDVGQIAKSAIEVALAVVKGTGEIAPERAEKLLYALEADLGEIWQPGARVAIGEIIEAKTKTVDGKPRPAGDFLVVEDPDSPSTWHLPVKKNGTPDHRLMAAARAALTVGYRGNKYEGPDKSKALSKLKSLYKSEEMEWGELATTEMSDVMIQAENDVLTATLADIDALRERVAKRVGEHLGESDLTEAMAEVSLVGDVSEEDVAELQEQGVVVDTGRRAPVLVDFQILKPGPGNKRDQHYYPADVLERDIHVFKGADIFVTDHNALERGEQTKVGRLRDCPVRFTEAAAPVGRAIIYDPDQAEKTRNRADAGELSTLECSIFGRGRAKPGKVNGKTYKVVEALTEGRFLELVSKAGAGGHALNLAESESGGSDMSEVENVAEETTETSEVEEVALAEGEQEQAVEEQEPEAPVMLAEADVQEMVESTNLPEFAKRALQAAEYADKDALSAAIAETVSEVKKLTGSGQVFGQGQTSQPQEPVTEQDIQERLDAIDVKYGLKEV